MLVLSRKQMESIVIGDNTVVTVLSVVGNKVRLGIEAPSEIPVLRSELQKAKHHREATPFVNRLPDLTDPLHGFVGVTLAKTPTRTVTVTNPQGLHLRPCSAIVDTVNSHKASVTVQRGSQSVNANSILGLLSLAAPSGAELVLSAMGAEAEVALDAVAGLFTDEFEIACAH
jgi:carbon storage regulator CsrA